MIFAERVLKTFNSMSEIFFYFFQLPLNSGKRTFNSFRKLFVGKSSLFSNKEKNDN